MSTKINIDPESGAAYMKTSDAPISYTLPIDDGILADYDKNGGVVGIEVIYASKSKNLNWSALHSLAAKKSKGTAKKSVSKMSK